MKKVISWCFFVDEKAKIRLPEYLFGLRCNKIGAELWFPDWHLRLYIDKSVYKYPSVLKFIIDICYSKKGPKIDLLLCREGFNPTIERYRPFFDKDVEICIARDIDSILSKTDAEYVDRWLSGEYGDDVDILCYREYMQPNDFCMGGGIGIKTKKFSDLSTVFYATPLEIFDRGIDEPQLKTLMSYGKTKHIVTKMTASGIYCILNYMYEKPSESEILWNVPFFDTTNGYLYEYNGCDCLADSEIDLLVEIVKKIKIRLEHTHPHCEEHLKNIRNNINDQWVR